MTQQTVNNALSSNLGFFETGGTFESIANRAFDFAIIKSALSNPSSVNQLQAGNSPELQLDQSRVTPDITGANFVAGVDNRVVYGLGLLLVVIAGVAIARS